MVISQATAFAIVAAGVFLLTGLLSGLWKFIQMWKSTQGLAHAYVDIAHRASLLYGFACITLAVLSYFSTYSPQSNLIAVVVVILRSKLLPAMDHLSGQIQTAGSSAIKKFRQIHSAALLINLLQLVLLVWALLQFSL